MPTQAELRAELEYVIEPQVRQYCGPIFFTRSLHWAEGYVTANGSFGLVDTGSKKLLVTCHHVWDEFQRGRLNDPDLRMCLSVGKGPAVPFNPTNTIGEDRQSDIVAFDMGSLTAAIGALKFFSLRQNPAPRVAQEDIVFFSGFPGKLRLAEGRALTFSRAPCVVRLCSADPWHFRLNVSEFREEAR